MKFDPDRFVRRIVIEAKHENPEGPVLVTEEPDYEYRMFRADEPIRPRPHVFKIEGLSERDWTITWETDYRDDFKKVASVVGKDKAGEVLRALKRAVPENWEGKD